MNEQFKAVAIQVEKSEITLEELITRGQDLRVNKDNISWEMGDLAIEVTRLFGKNALRIFAQNIGIEVGTIRRYRDVSKAYPPEVREELAMLSWSHFRQVAANPDRVLILKRAHDENWSFEKLCTMTKKDQTDVIDDGKIVPPKPEMEFCLNCRRWYLVDQNSVCPSQGQCPEIK
jgi:hypothetical protein